MIIGPDAAALGGLAGASALVAAVATVLGAAFLVLFFAKGGLWGLLNDIASIVLMLATIPVLLFLAMFTSGRTVSPGVLISTMKKLMPLCLGASGSLRARTKIQFAP